MGRTRGGKAERRAGDAERRPAAGAREAESRSFLRSVGAVGAITLLSRLTGLVRVSTQAHFLGTLDAADAFRIAFQIPSLFRRLVGEGALPSVFVPIVAAYRGEGDEDAIRILAEKFYTLWSVVLLAVTALGIAASGWLLALYGDYLMRADLDGSGAWPPEKIALTVQLTRFLFIYLFFIGLSAVAQGLLNGLGVFALPAATPLLFNLAFVTAGYALQSVFPGEQAVWSFVVGVLAGGVLQFLLLVPAQWRRGIRFRPRWPFDHPGVREILRLVVPATFGAGIYQINVLVSMLIAMTVEIEGAVSSLDYSSRLMEFVLGVFVFALSTVGLTRLAARAAAGETAEVRRILSQVLRLTCFITIPSMAGMWVLGVPIIELTLSGGEFDARSLELTLSAFRCHLPGLLFVGVSRVLVAAFYAHREVWIPARLSVAPLLLNAVLCVWLAKTALGHAGIALASSLSAVLQVVLLLVVFQRRHRLVDLPAATATLVRSCVAALAMGGACEALLLLFPATSPGRLFLLFEVAFLVVAGAAVYFAASWLLRGSELRELLGPIIRRRRD